MSQGVVLKLSAELTLTKAAGQPMRKNAHHTRLNRWSRWARMFRSSLRFTGASLAGREG